MNTDFARTTLPLAFQGLMHRPLPAGKKGKDSKNVQKDQKMMRFPKIRWLAKPILHTKRSQQLASSRVDRDSAQELSPIARVKQLIDSPSVYGIAKQRLRESSCVSIQRQAAWRICCAMLTSGLRRCLKTRLRDASRGFAAVSQHSRQKAVTTC